MKNLDFLNSNIIAHRGYHVKYKENTLESFKEAVLKKYIIELDVHLIKDKTVIVFHDDNLKRMIKIDKKIKECTKEELKKYNIPTLSEVLSLVDGQVPLIIELKYDQKVGLLEEEIVKLLDNYKGDFCVKSFNPFIVRWFYKNRPNYIRGFLISNRAHNLKEQFCQTKLAFSLAHPDFISCHYSLYSKVKKYKLPTIAWTIKNQKQFSKYKNKFTNLIVDFDIKGLK